MEGTDAKKAMPREESVELEGRHEERFFAKQAPIGLGIPAWIPGDILWLWAEYMNTTQLCC